VADWNPATYERFKDERSRPFFDLLALVAPIPGGSAADLGCGTGELTALLHRETRAARTIGIDTSAAMLARARPEPGLTFAQGDLATWRPDAPLDLIFANASLHWADDHPALLARLSGFLAPGGQLAVQVPANHDHPSHLIAAEVAQEAPFAAALAGYVRRSPVLAPVAYARVLDGLGFTELRVRLEVYVHHLASREAVIDWVRGTLLTAYESRMPAELWPRFLERYRERLLPALEDTKPYFYPFARILFAGSQG
jgi:trans-aconitate 2-methyltransferase